MTKSKGTSKVDVCGDVETNHAAPSDPEQMCSNNSIRNNLVDDLNGGKPTMVFPKSHKSDGVFQRAIGSEIELNSVASINSKESYSNTMDSHISDGTYQPNCFGSDGINRSDRIDSTGFSYGDLHQVPRVRKINAPKTSVNSSVIERTIGSGIEQNSAASIDLKKSHSDNLQRKRLHFPNWRINKTETENELNSLRYTGVYQEDRIDDSEYSFGDVYQMHRMQKIPYQSKINSYYQPNKNVPMGRSKSDPRQAYMPSLNPISRVIQGAQYELVII